MATKDGPLNWRQKGIGGSRASSPGGSGGGRSFFKSPTSKRPSMPEQARMRAAAKKAKEKAKRLREKERDTAVKDDVSRQMASFQRKMRSSRLKDSNVPGTPGYKTPQKPPAKYRRTLTPDDFVPTRMTSKKISPSLKQELVKRGKSMPDKRTQLEVRRIRMTGAKNKAKAMALDMRTKGGPS